jgi:hypothetical protein
MRCVVLVILGLVLLEGCYENYVPDPHEIQVIGRWEPFIKETERFEFALTSFDDGGMIFLFHVDKIDFDEHMLGVLEAANRAGWSEIVASDARLNRRPKWLRVRYDFLVNKACQNEYDTKFFARKLHQDDEHDTSVEYVELAYCETRMNIVFVSHYAND